jgi:hypothetical protein
MINQQRCSECGRVATLRMGAAQYRCAHCRYPPFVDLALEHFTADERSRLEIYRRAVAAGFYSDW